MNVVIIPAYQPEQALTELVQKLVAENLGVLVVDDGSDAAHQPIFDTLSGATVIHAPQNEGKGAALKRGFAALQVHFPDCRCFVTADADGQHSITDILRVIDELERGAEFVLTTRRFKRDMPARSKFGNDLSRIIYTMLTGHWFADNQSGLRGFTVGQIDWLLKVKGSKYDYEMNMLYYADKQRITVTTLPIEAIYIDDNRSSHFHPVRDTLRIYGRLFSSAWASFAGIGVWEHVVLLFTLLMGYKEVYYNIGYGAMLAAAVTILLNKYIIFRRVNYSDGVRTLLYTALRSIVYTGGTMLIGAYLPMIPMFFAFNFMALVCLPLEYLLHMSMHFASYKEVNR